MAAQGSKPGTLEKLIQNTNDVGELLREDDSLLRQTFFGILKEHHPKLATKLDLIYALSQVGLLLIMRMAWKQGFPENEFNLLNCLSAIWRHIYLQDG